MYQFAQTGAYRDMFAVFRAQYLASSTIGNLSADTAKRAVDGVVMGGVPV